MEVSDGFGVLRDHVAELSGAVMSAFTDTLCFYRLVMSVNTLQVRRGCIYSSKSKIYHVSGSPGKEPLRPAHATEGEIPVRVVTELSA